MMNSKYTIENIDVLPWCEIKDSKGKVSVKIPTDSFMEFLECLDFRTTLLNGKYQIVRVQDNIITTVKDNWDIVNVVSQWLEDNSVGAELGDVYTHQVKSALLNKTPHLFNRTNLGYIKRIEINRHWDTVGECYMYFLDTVVCVTKHGFKCLEYVELNGHVFKEQIIQRNFKTL